MKTWKTNGGNIVGGISIKYYIESLFVEIATYEVMEVGAKPTRRNVMSLLKMRLKSQGSDHFYFFDEKCVDDVDKRNEIHAAIAKKLFPEFYINK